MRNTLTAGAKTEAASIAEEDKASLVVNLKIQRDWSEMTMLCKGLQAIGIENVALVPHRIPLCCN